MSLKRITHITSLHNRYDTRIFWRECVSLARKNYDVTLIVNDGKKDEIKENVKIKSIFKIKNTIPRKLLVPLIILFKILKLKPDIVHFHDPELIPLGLFLKGILRKDVIYDVHENYLSYDKNKIYFTYIKWLNKMAGKNLKLVFAETSYAKNYPVLKNYTEVLNYPDLNFFKKFEIKNILQNKNDLVYIGGVNKDRGIREIIDSLAIIEKKNPNLFNFFHIIGSIRSEKELNFIKSGLFESIKHKIKFYGHLQLEDAYKIANKCIMGVAVTLPIKNYKESLSTKVFEYMAVGLPQVYSDFEIYGDLRKTGTGFAIEPTKDNIIKVFKKYLDSDELKTSMHNASLIVRNQYTADTQIDNLINLMEKDVFASK